MTNAATTTPLLLTDEIKEAVNAAFDNRTPIVVVYVDENGQPSMSMRGTTQAWSDTQLAIWARGTSNMPKALNDRPRLTLWYRDPATRTTLQFRGHAHVDNDPQVRDVVFDRSPAAEQAADPERKGVVLIVDLDRVDGRLPSGPVAMSKDA